MGLNSRGLKIGLIMVILYIGMLGCYSPIMAADSSKNSQINFNDLTKSDPNLNYIQYLSGKGIITGYPDGSFKPQEGLTRAQAAVVLVKAGQLKLDAQSASPFKDLKTEHWARPYIAAAVKAGYLSGFPDGTFHPEEKISRAQAVSLVLRLSKQNLNSAELPSLTDINSSHWAAPAVATGIAAGMVGLSADGKQFYPDQPMTRGKLARALGTLLTKDPGLYTKNLEGSLEEVKGEVQVTQNGKTTTAKSNTRVYVGDTIITGAGSSARLTYPDGSSMLIDEKTEMNIKESRGREYIKMDGSANTAVEYLNLDVKKGTVFGAVATKREAQDKVQAQSRRPLLASLDGFGLLAAAPAKQDMPWYNTAQTKKVKVKVDMPWGVAAVRGTFLRVTVNPDGTCNVSCLTGTIDVSGNSGGSVTLGGGQTGGIGQGGTSAEKTGMSDKDKQEFNKVQDFIVQSALQMDMQKEAVVGVIVETPGNVPGGTPEQQAHDTLKVVLDALKASGIELRPEVIEKLEKDIQKEINVTPTQQEAKSGSSGSGPSPNPTPQAISYGMAGIYGPDLNSSPQTISGDVIVSASGVTLQNMIITGRLFLAEGIGEGDVTLKKVKVQGETKITGGGPNSVQIIDCELYTVSIDKENNQIRIVAKGSTLIGAVNLNSGAKLEECELNGQGFGSVNIGSLIPAGANIILSGNFAAVNIEVPNVRVEVASGNIGQINLAASAAGTTLDLAAGVNVTALQVNASGAQVMGSGTINTANINASGVVIAQTPANINVANGVTASVGGQVKITVTNPTPGCLTLDSPIILTALGGPLSNDSWNNIQAKIKANTGTGLNWITGITSVNLRLTPNADGNSACLYNDSTGPAAIIQANFTIPANQVVNGAGNVVPSDIVIEAALPAQSGAPAFTAGTPATFGTELTVGVGNLGIRTNLTYTWYRSTNEIYEQADTLVGTGQNYTPAAADVAKYLIVVARSSDAGGYGTVATSALVAAVPITGIGSIIGQAKIGVQLTAGELIPAGATVSYQWLRDGDGWMVIEDATTNHYTPTKDDVWSEGGARIKVVATGTGGYSGEVESTPTEEVAPAVVNSIISVTAPAGGTPVTSITTDQYTGSVTWLPADTTFAAGKSYTATIILEAKQGYTLSGVAANYFSVAGATTSNLAGSGEVTAVFPVTLEQVGRPGWEENTIGWEDVTNALGYRVQLYKNGLAAGDSLSLEPETTSHPFELSTGRYTVTVQAIGDGLHYLDGPVSEYSVSKPVAVIASESTIVKGAVPPPVVVTLDGAQFDETAGDPNKWTISTGNTGLAVSGITRNDPYQATISFTGTPGVGTVSIGAKATAISGDVESNIIELVVLVPAP